MISDSFSWQGARAAEARPVGRMAEGAPARALADSDGEDSQRARFDPLTHPVAITGHSVIGDQLRAPAAGCAMAGCEASFADPAALGEADNRARAVAAGWVNDALGRLICLACQRDRPLPPWWVHPPQRGAGRDDQPAAEITRPAAATGDHQPAGEITWPAGDASLPAQPLAPERPPAEAPGRDHRTQWPRLRSVLGSGRDGSSVPARSHRATSASRSEPADPRPAASVSHRATRRP